MKEFFRKFMVSLKRSPQNIPLVALAVAFIYYSLNLTKISDTTAKIQGAQMGLSGFITMLLSMLVFVCFINSFPKRKKPNFIMIALMYVMFAAMIACDINYRYRVNVAMNNPDFKRVVDASPFIAQAKDVVTVHIILIAVVAVLVALIPVYSKLLKKVKTSIDVEYTEAMGEIEVEEE